MNSKQLLCYIKLFSINSLSWKFAMDATPVFLARSVAVILSQMTRLWESKT